jgi:hypothetical protein
VNSAKAVSTFKRRSIARQDRIAQDRINLAVPALAGKHAVIADARLHVVALAAMQEWVAAAKAEPGRGGRAERGILTRSTDFPSWPGLSRPSTSYFVVKTWMLGTRPGMTSENFTWAAGTNPAVTSLKRLSDRVSPKIDPLDTKLLFQRGNVYVG